ncbi:MAG: 2-succinyl-6-hydroxy-2,4-cyclohexadiene-1-carboxylate synthase [Chloroflexales bacterium]|nr:2-succinyl-6-hydroxy-2,4-cyclohexadiene-1-carboxylate synthase [Chloroflexales bacterium]
MKLAVNNLMFHVEQAGSGYPLLLLHGFTGSAATWGAHIPHFATRRQIIAPDLIGHGQTDAPANAARYSMAHCVADLLTLLDTLEVERADVLGYSMGGRVALHLAVAAPHRVRSLLLESATPGIDKSAERAERVRSDEALADAIENDGVAAFVKRWERLPLFDSQVVLPPEVRANLHSQRLQNRSIGLANSLRGMGTGQQQHLWDKLSVIKMSTLLLVGELDAKYCATARRMAKTLPRVRMVVVLNAGHTIHLEQPDIFEQEVTEFLDSVATASTDEAK